MVPFTMEPIGRIQSCFTEKFGIPRQPGLVPEARAVLEILPPYDRPEAFRGLATFSHIWLLFVFHGLDRDKWRPTVRPPRLGGNQRVGVFASRSGFRPNPIGQSVVALLDVRSENSTITLHLGGVDLLDGTPVLDIKPYVPYSDSIPQARGGFAATAPEERLTVAFAPQADAACRELDPAAYPDLKALILGLLHQDPRPAYKESGTAKQYGMRLWDLNVRFTVDGTTVFVDSIDSGKPSEARFDAIERPSNQRVGELSGGRVAPS